MLTFPDTVVPQWYPSTFLLLMIEWSSCIVLQVGVLLKCGHLAWVCIKPPPLNKIDIHPCKGRSRKRHSVPWHTGYFVALLSFKQKLITYRVNVDKTLFALTDIAFINSMVTPNTNLLFISAVWLFATRCHAQNVKGKDKKPILVCVYPANG